MKREELNMLTDEELLKKKKELKKSKTFFAFCIGFLGAIFVFGFVGWLLSPEKQFGFFIPMLFPLLFIRIALTRNKKNAILEDVLKDREL